jgi:hypothetical protein
MNPIKFDVFGTRVLIQRTNTAWDIRYVNDQGKMRPATDIFIPEFITETELEQYLADLRHEWATEEHPTVLRID